MIRQLIFKDNVVLMVPDGRIMDVYCRHLGREPKNIESAIRHIRNCKWCQKYLKEFDDAEKSNLYISK